ncbi:hypothetical protein ABIE64_004348 [Thalassospira sp. MBR-102]
MALGVEMLVERIFSGARWVVGNDRERALVDDGLAEVIGVVGGVGHDRLDRQVLDQGFSLRHVTLLACGEREAHRASQAAHGHMDLGAQPAPAACWWARTMVESTIRYSKSGSS